MLLESYSSETSSEYLRQYAKIEAKDEELQTQYRKERSRLEKELEESYSRRRDLYELERSRKMLVDLVIDALIGPMSESARREIKKTLERAAIKAFCAPPIISGRKDIVDKYDEEIGILAMTNKTAITTLAAQMDSSINDLGQKAISEAVSKNSNSFEDLNPKKKK